MRKAIASTVILAVIWLVLTTIITIISHFDEESSALVFWKTGLIAVGVLGVAGIIMGITLGLSWLWDWANK